jgi:membrane fusion protein (multidrug efflux system)
VTTESAAPPPGRAPHRRTFAVGVVGAGLLAAFLAGYVPRLRARALLAEQARSRTVVPQLAVTTAVSLGTIRELKLPGNLVAVTQTMVYARASGYVRKWHADIGARVHAGDLLAELDTPELTAQLDQGQASLSQKRAALGQAEATNAFLQVSAERQTTLFRQNLVAKESADQAVSQAAVGTATVAAAKADIAAQESNVRQLAQLLAYSQVTAPFDGVITQRLVDVGSLVNAGASQGAALFQLQAADPLRVFMQVPQTYAPSVRDGADARVEVRQYTGRSFAGKVVRSAGALDPATRTLTTEVDVPNPSGELFPGMYVDVTLPLAVSHPVVRVPSSAVIYDESGVHLAVVVAGSRVELSAIKPGRDNGTDVEIVEGLNGGESVVVSPPAGLVDGADIHAARMPAPATDGGR